MSVKDYLKFIAQVAATVLGGIVTATVSGPITSAGWINIIISTLGAIGVLGAGELPAGVWSYTKVAVAGLTAAAMTLSTFIAGGVTLAEILQICAAFLGAIVVGVAPGPVVKSIPSSVS